MKKLNFQDRVRIPRVRIPRGRIPTGLREKSETAFLNLKANLMPSGVAIKLFCSQIT
jgi:hypothetical protein